MKIINSIKEFFGLTKSAFIDEYGDFDKNDDDYEYNVACSKR
jgi:hypothetical protein